MSHIVTKSLQRCVIGQGVVVSDFAFQILGKIKIPVCNVVFAKSAKYQEIKSEESLIIRLLEGRGFLSIDQNPPCILVKGNDYIISKGVDYKFNASAKGMKIIVKLDIS